MSPFLLSFKLSLLTTGILMLLALPVGYGLAFSRWKGRPFLEALIALPLVLPPTVLGFYLLLLMGNHGAVGRLWEALFHHRLAFSFAGLVFASVCYSLPYAIQPLQASFQALNPRLLEASWTLGASKRATFFRIVLPNSLPGILSALVLTFAHTMGEFGVVLMVGGNIPGETRSVSIAIYDLVEALDYGQAGLLAFILLLLSYGILLVVYVSNRKVFPWQR